DLVVSAAEHGGEAGGRRSTGGLGAGCCRNGLWRSVDHCHGCADLTSTGPDRGHGGVSWGTVPYGSDITQPPLDVEKRRKSSISTGDGRFVHDLCGRMWWLVR